MPLARFVAPTRAGRNKPGEWYVAADSSTEVSWSRSKGSEVPPVQGARESQLESRLG